MAFFGGAINPTDSLLFSVGRIRQFRVGHSGLYSLASGTAAIASVGFTGGGFNINMNAGSSAAGNSKVGYFDPTVAQMTASLGKIDYSRRIRFSIGGMMNLNSTNSAIRIVFGGTGNATAAPAANADGLTIKGFGAEFALQSGVIQARLIGYNSSYLTPTAYTTLTNGFGLASSDTRFFGLVLESDGTGNIYLYASESSTAPNVNIGTTPLLTLTGGPTNDTSTNRFGPEIQCVNHATVAPTGSPSAIFQSTFWMIDVQ